MPQEWLKKHDLTPGRKSTVLDLYGTYSMPEKDRLSEVPPEVWQLTQLTELDLGGHHLSQLPPEIGRLTRLRKLGLYGNDLSSLPPEIAKLRQLRELNLGKNERLTALPPEIGALAHLQVLKLGSCNRLKTLPPEIGQLRQLRVLELNHTALQAMPPEIGQLVKLEELTLTRCPLTSLPDEIAALAKLRKLYAPEAKLEALPLEWDLSRVKELKLDGNPLKSFRLERAADHPVDVQARNAWGRTALHWAAQAELPAALGGEVLTSLLALGADPNTADAWGYTPLHEAAMQGCAGRVAALLAAGAEPAARVQQGPQAGATALELAIYESQRTSEARQSRRYEAALELLQPCSPEPGAEQSDWYLKAQRGTYQDKTATKVAHLAGKKFDYRQQRWLCRGSAATGYTVSVQGKPLSSLNDSRPMMWQGPLPQAEGCLICQSKDLIMVYNECGVSYSDGDLSWDCEAFCSTCGWYSQWLYDE
jgi:hypothetical protein